MSSNVYVICIDIAMCEVIPATRPSDSWILKFKVQGCYGRELYIWEQLIITKGEWGWGEGGGRSLKNYNRRNLEDDSKGQKMNECHRSQLSKSLPNGASGFQMQ